MLHPPGKGLERPRAIEENECADPDGSFGRIQEFVVDAARIAGVKAGHFGARPHDVRHSQLRLRAGDAAQIMGCGRAREAEAGQFREGLGDFFAAFPEAQDGIQHRRRALQRQQAGSQGTLQAEPKVRGQTQQDISHGPSLKKATSSRSSTGTTRARSR